MTTQHHRTEAWSRAGVLVTGGTKQLVSLSKTFPKAGQYTVQFSLHPIDAVVSKIECEAIIEWGCAGNAVTRRVTVMPGQSISGTADSVRVRIQDVTSTGTPGQRYSVTALIVPGTRPTTGQPPLLYPAFFIPGSGQNNPVTLTPNTSHTYDIPEGVGVTGANVLVHDASAGAVSASIPEGGALVQQLGPGAPTLMRSYDARVFEYVPLMPGANQLRVFNKAAGISLIFSTAFTIDG